MPKNKHKPSRLCYHCQIRQVVKGGNRIYCRKCTEEMPSARTIKAERAKAMKPVTPAINPAQIKEEIINSPQGKEIPSPAHPEISPQNRMDETLLKSIDFNQTPVITMNDNEGPLYIYLAKANYLESGIDFLMAIQHLKKTNEIQIKGRVRFNTSGNKQMFHGKETLPFTPTNMILLKRKIKETINFLFTNYPFNLTIHPPLELEFEVDESTDSVLQKMNETNAFNIGILPLK